MEYRLTATGGMTDEYYIRLSENGFKYRFEKVERDYYEYTKCYVTIDSLEDLMKLINLMGQEVVIMTNSYGDNGYEPEIEIYDGYRE